MGILSEWKKAERNFTRIANDGKHRTRGGQLKYDRKLSAASKKATRLFRAARKKGYLSS